MELPQTWPPVKLVAQLREESRTATIEERKVLMKYSGWGGLGRDITYGEQSYEVDRMREEGVITEEEYQSWFDSDSNAYYPDYYLAKGIWQAMVDNGFQGGRVAETSAGTGHFISAIPPDLADNIDLTAIEREHSSGQILHHLYGDTADVRISLYEKVFLPNESIDLAIGNIPFGDIRVFDRKEFGSKTELVHDYFMLRTLKKLKHGGVQAFITSTGTLGGSAQLGLGYTCGKFDPVAAVTNTLNDIGAGVDNMMNAMTAAATSAIASLPALILQRANPGLYDLFQNALIKAEETMQLATKSCEQMEAEIASAGGIVYASV